MKGVFNLTNTRIVMSYLTTDKNLPLYDLVRNT